VVVAGVHKVELVRANIGGNDMENSTQWRVPGLNPAARMGKPTDVIWAWFKDGER
jgi:hypothetical protein